MNKAAGTRPDGLPSYAVFAAMLASAGLPIYIHAPKYFVDQYGVSFAALGVVLFVLRLFDFVQDPFLGWLSERLGNRRGTGAAIGGVVMAAAMIGLFAVTPPVEPLLWFAITLTCLFSGFSFLTINFYAQGVQKARALGSNGHVRLASWRESGALLGICIAAASPAMLMQVSAAPFQVFAFLFAAFAMFALAAMRGHWGVSAPVPPTGLRELVGDKITRRLLWIALVNAAPVAVTSTLFLFFVEGRLGAPGWEGPLLVLFFLSAAVSAPLWGLIAQKTGAKPALLGAMCLAIISFGWAGTLGTGDTLAFAIICVASGFALGGDLTLLPAIFARRMARIAPNAGQAFGLWSFVSKFTLAFAAILLLPLLEVSGFQSGLGQSSDAALWMLTMLYALVPCGLKFIAIALLAATSLEEDA